MLMYKKESLEELRQKIDLVEVVSSHIQMQKSGAAYKALCPFHEEKTPSFTIQRGNSHYHCFGCGAHGDAIAFLMGHLKMGFLEAIESLAERFQITLEKTEGGEEQKKGPSRSALKQALELACRFYHFSLLHAQEADTALKYLYERGIDLEFIRLFRVGYAPRESNALIRFLGAQGINMEVIAEAGLTSRGRDFFIDRITFPITDAMGSVIGFSARKYREETFGGKYINSPETPLFKKSHALYGLSYSRQRIAKEKRALIVEGQIDALRLIYSGFNFTVASQGTAFGEDHVKELIHLGIEHAYLAFDADTAGREAAVKVGDLFQKKGIEVSVLGLPEDSDPDSFLREEGPPAFIQAMETSADYLTFLVDHFSQNLDMSSPSQKNALVQKIASKVRLWEQPLLVHETLRKLAQITSVPESTLGIGQELIPNLYIKRAESGARASIDADCILESDVLRWLFLLGETDPTLVEIVKSNVTENHFRNPQCKRFFILYLDAYQNQKPRDLLSFGIQCSTQEEEKLLAEIMQRKVNLQRAKEGLTETVRKLLMRSWMEEREAIKTKIQSGRCSDEEALALAKLFDEIKKKTPEVILP